MKTTAELILDIYSTVDEALKDDDYKELPLFLVIDNDLSVYYTDGAHNLNSIFSVSIDKTQCNEDIKIEVFKKLIS